MRRRLKKLLSSILVPGAVALTAGIANACPMCNQSIAGQDQLPHAYMYSILFMLGMPAVVFTGIGGAIYLKFRRFYASAPACAPVEPSGDWPANDDISRAA